MAPARSWRCRGMTSAISNSRANMACRSSAWSRPGCRGRRQARSVTRRRPATACSSLRLARPACDVAEAKAAVIARAEARRLGRGQDRLAAARLGRFAPALLGHADPVHPLRRLRRGAGSQLFLGIELLSIPLYILCASETRREGSLESGLEYSDRRLGGIGHTGLRVVAGIRRHRRDRLQCDRSGDVGQQAVRRRARERDGAAPVSG